MRDRPSVAKQQESFPTSPCGGPSTMTEEATTMFAYRRLLMSTRDVAAVPTASADCYRHETRAGNPNVDFEYIDTIHSLMV